MKRKLRYGVLLERAHVAFTEHADFLKQKVPENVFATLQKNAEHVHVERLVYTSTQGKVVGFRICPKKVEGGLPAIIYNRGGTGDFGMLLLGHVFGKLAAFARAGYVVYASQYAGNAGGEGKDYMGGSDVEDVLNLYPLIKKDPQTDEKRIGMVGVSRGGTMTYLSMARVTWIKAAVSCAGVADFTAIDAFRPGFNKHLKETFGGSKKEKIARSALYWSDALHKKTPLLLLHGTADWRVNPLDSLRLSQQLLEHKHPHRLILYEGADHALTEFDDEAFRQTVSWLDRFVKHKEKLPNLKKHGV